MNNNYNLFESTWIVTPKCYTREEKYMRYYLKNKLDKRSDISYIEVILSTYFVLVIRYLIIN
ncbi:MAG: hypothetical protein Ct9H300mP6_06130 [Gammaproteobacteria bacterium]|nr:MAG: hypothetical protein Ct9H300mP6_06130 [Gammaproteobacteria bacterium]